MISFWHDHVRNSADGLLSAMGKIVQGKQSKAKETKMAILKSVEVVLKTNSNRRNICSGTAMKIQ